MSDTATLPGQAEGLPVNRQHMPFELDAGIAERAAIGVIVLGSDQTVEHEFRRIIDLPGVAFYESRIHNAATITPETLKAMEAGIADCTDRILKGLPLDVVAYGCTSGAMMIGDDNVAARIHEARPGVATTTPMAAAMAAFTALGCRRIALLTPYIDEINQAMRAHIEKAGFTVPVMGSFNEENDNKVGRISLESVCGAALELGRHEAVDAVFVSCTALRLVDGVAKLEAELGKPVTSSNHAMAWHCLRLAGVEDSLPQFGRLFTTRLA
ncbi:MAG: Asp/Glu racemase [Rhodospirillales bacterium]|nr:Asp/Glu racemase [Rhodospirillales bacterium]